MRTWLLLLSLGACAHTPPSAGPPPTRCTTPWPWVGGPLAPDVPGLDDLAWRGAIDQPLSATLQARLSEGADRSLLDSRSFGLQITVLIPGEGSWATARGQAAIDDPRPVTLQDRFQAASAGKLATAIAVHQLIGEGAISLATPMSTWAPGPNGDAVTVEHLLAHTSGIPSFNNLPTPLPKGAIPPDTLRDLAFAQEPLFCPGATFSYSNTGYLLLGQLLEHLDGAPLPELLATRVLGPAGMADTVAQRWDQSASTVGGHVDGARVDADQVYGLPQGAGTLATTAPDLARLLLTLLRGELVPDARALAHPLHPWPDAPISFGRGLMRFDTPYGALVGHSGGTQGFKAFVGALPGPRPVIVAVMVNHSSDVARIGVPEAIAMRALEAVTADR